MLWMGFADLWLYVGMAMEVSGRMGKSLEAEDSHLLTYLVAKKEYFDFCLFKRR